MSRKHHYIGAREGIWPPAMQDRMSPGSLADDEHAAVHFRSATERLPRAGQLRAPGSRNKAHCSGSTQYGAAPAEVPRRAIALIDDHEFTRGCLAESLKGLSGDFIEPFATVSDFLSSDKGPFTLVLHYVHGEFGPGFGENLARLIGTVAPTPAIIVSDIDSSSTMMQAFAAGARGYLPSTSTSLQVAVEVMRVVRAGGQFAPINAALMMQARSHVDAQLASTASQFTDRQRAVLERLVRGDANKVIAHELGMSESTVKVHVRHIMRKMNATNRLQAAFRAYHLAQGTQG
jgi:DNA-binding NarL/FixJ family response regulator